MNDVTNNSQEYTFSILYAQFWVEGLSWH